MSQNRRTFIPPRQPIRLPNIATGIQPVSDVRESVQSQPQKSPRRIEFQWQTSTSRNAKTCPDPSGNHERLFPAESLSSTRRHKTWGVGDAGRGSHRASPEVRETGLYNPTISDMFVLLSHREDSVALPPSESPRVGDLLTVDQDKVREKQYVLDDIYRQPVVSRFERDELYIPSVYSKYFACRECRTAYVSKMFTKQYVRRNNRDPKCFKPSNAEKERRHFCDVLGKRFCASCMERENRKFSRSLQQLPLGHPQGESRALSQTIPKTPPRRISPTLPNTQPLELTDYTHQSHSSKKPKKVIGIDLRFASM